jgi:hypothetical protein
MRNRRKSEIAAAISAYNDSDPDMLLTPASPGCLPSWSLMRMYANAAS